ncbi:hypothetical protein [Afipia clevelandensis]|uniref:NIPSNAP domain-containing protein n=1 Tax=Afipia clevelandensis ATCC 49720 TaxID=883079 RepID=K8PAT4_9BRAD|nr:hypothetical protein [Afipia clevelandensis]EKS38661.1 hypothetical protein HMPREF9696_01130 [Afipia clevelandensis ATCC 49720]
MALLGKAAVAMWWDMAREQRAEFEDWHSHEHFPERLHLPGFLRGSRWAAADGGVGFFVFYELDAWETLTSPDYLARLNDPTPWSKKMMPHHRNMVRSQCRVIASHGGGIGGAMLTLRLSPQPAQASALSAHLRDVVARLPEKGSFTGAHLLHTDTPQAGQTEEQRIRGGDAAADWIVLVSGSSSDALQEIAHGLLAPKELEAEGAAPGALPGLFRLKYAMTPQDLLT